MIEVSDKVFQKLLEQAIDLIPVSYAKRMNNVAMVWSHAPTDEQRQKLKLRGDQTLFGLYEGIPLTKRNNNYSMVLPDKITIFKDPLCLYAGDLHQLKREIGHTLWHEVAHHFGLGHDRIHELDKRNVGKKNEN
ncbi:MAG: metallopeptidase family protein [Candidatus Saccharimonadales bacterium]